MVEQIEAILFDFDGVLADTEPLHYECWREALKAVEIDLDWEFYCRECIGIADRAMLATLARLADPPKEIDELLPLYPRKKELFRDLAATRKLVREDIISAMKSMDGIKLAVVTSSGRSEIEPILKKEGVFDLLQTTVYGGEVRKLKPDPEPYATAMARLGVTRALAIEDSDAGVASAEGAGCRVARVASPAEVAGILWGVLNFR